MWKPKSARIRRYNEMYEQYLKEYKWESPYNYNSFRCFLKTMSFEDVLNKKKDYWKIKDTIAEIIVKRKELWMKDLSFWRVRDLYREKGYDRAINYVPHKETKRTISVEINEIREKNWLTKFSYQHIKNLLRTKWYDYACTHERASIKVPLWERLKRWLYRSRRKDKLKENYEKLITRNIELWIKNNSPDCLRKTLPNW